MNFLLVRRTLGENICLSCLKFNLSRAPGQVIFYTPVESIMESSVRLSVRPQLLVNAISWKPLVGLTSHFDMALILSDAIDFGHSTKTKLAATAVWRLTLYPMQDIACERDILKTACRIDFTFWYGLNTTKTSDTIDLGHSTKTKMATTAVYCLWRRYLENRLSASLHILIRPYFQVVNLIPCKLHLLGV